MQAMPPESGATVHAKICIDALSANCDPTMEGTERPGLRLLHREDAKTAKKDENINSNQHKTLRLSSSCPSCPWWWRNLFATSRLGAVRTSNAQNRGADGGE
jgi:hypothetical protein